MNDDELCKRDLETVHYQPATQMTWCGAMQRALEQNDHSWKRVHTTTNITLVTCPVCRAHIRQHVAGWRIS